MAKPLDGTPLQFHNLTRVQQSDANKIVAKFGSDFSNTARAAGKSSLEQFDANPLPENQAKRAKGRRLINIADEHVDKPLTLRSAAKNRVDAVTAAATTQRGKGESLGGAGWYFDAHAKIAAKAKGIPVGVAAAASSAMSPGADPKSERSATGALAAAHVNPHSSVHFSSALVGNLRAAGHDVPVPVGTSMHFSKVPAHLIPELAHDTHRAEAESNSSGVNWAGIGKVASRANIVKATKIMRGDTPLSAAQDPYGAPKTSSYTDNLTRAVPGTPEHDEYNARSQHLGATIRGEVHGGQGMLDFHGLRDSNEGILSNHGHTAEDSWMRAISVGHKNPETMKGAGDINPTRKSYTTREDVDEGGGKSHPVFTSHSVSRDARVKPTSVYHAWNNEATHKASEMLQTRHGLGYTVPSTLVQETAWTSKRREVGADPQWNAQARETNKAAKAEVKASKPAPTKATKNTPSGTVIAPTLPGMDSPKNKALATGSAANLSQAQFHLER